MFNPSPANPAPLPTSLGKLFRETREAQGITPNDAAQRLLLSKRIIEGIEQNDYSNIPARVYAEGYLKAYARFLRLSTDEIIHQFRQLPICFENEEHLSAATPQEESSSPKLSHPESCHFAQLKALFRRPLVIGGIALALLAGALIWSGEKFSPFTHDDLAQTTDQASSSDTATGGKNSSEELNEEAKVDFSGPMIVDDRAPSKTTSSSTVSENIPLRE